MSLNLPLQNISNIGSEIIMFNRQNNGKLSVMRDKTFKPYYYKVDNSGIFKGYFGEKLIKKICKNPYEVSQKRTNQSMESDIIYTRRYLIDQINIVKSQSLWIMADIEVLTDSFPDPNKADKPISSITCYDNFSKKYINFWLPEYKTEFLMLEDFIKYIKKIQPDIILFWNAYNFDFPYLYNRILDFSKKISPIGEEIYHNKYPMGISILDYMMIDKKFTLNKKKSYALEARAIEELNIEKENKVDFSTINGEVRSKNIKDVENMVKMEEKNKFLNLSNDIRIKSKCLWNDIEFNSRIIDQLILQISKSKGVVLPSRKSTYETIENQSEESEFEGAFREAFERGLFHKTGKYDLSGAYLYVIADLCLDSKNIRAKEVPNSIKINVTDRITQETKETFYMIQDINALLPSLARQLIHEKITYKDLKNNTNPETEEYKLVESKYEAIKTIFLSAWGVLGNRGFRLYDPRVAGMITSCIRDLIHYVNNKLQEKGFRVIYTDTDGCIVMDSGQDISILLNELIQQWSKERFNKLSSITFSYEGHFEDLFIKEKCHYIGRLRTSKGLKEEIKGIEAKRKNTSIFTAKFQKELLLMILDDKSQEECAKFIKDSIEKFKITSLMDIAFPYRIKTTNKSPHIGLRAYEYTNELYPKFIKREGDLLYYVYVEPFGTAERHATQMRKNKETGKKELKESNTIINKNVLAFDEENCNYIKNVDWNKMIDRSITEKIEIIFDVMKWNKELIGIMPKIKKERKKKEIIKQEPLIQSQPTFTEKDFICDFEECKKYENGICKGKGCPELCPKNNDNSIFEKEDLIKEKTEMSTEDKCPINNGQNEKQEIKSYYEE